VRSNVAEPFGLGSKYSTDAALLVWSQVTVPKFIRADFEAANARHAQVDAAEIGLVDAREELRLTIADRGVGIPADKLSRPGGLGLLSIRERTRLVNGTMQVQTSPHQGTTLTIVLPKR
jgi:signal transduction histidine kinase